MKNSSKKITVLILSAALAISSLVFSGCSRKNEPSASEETPSTLAGTETQLPGTAQTDPENSAAPTQSLPDNTGVPAVPDSTDASAQTEAPFIPDATSAPTVPETQPPTAPDNTVPETETSAGTDAASDPTVPDITDPPETQETQPSLTYEEYNKMSGQEQQKFYNSFANPEAFFAWYNQAKAEYEAGKDDIIIDGSGDIHINP